MSAVFADTSFYLALLRRGDPHHEAAVRESRVNRDIVTTELVLVELGSACARAADHADYLAMIEAIRATPRIHVVPFTTAQLDRGLAMMRSRPDKDWSLTDCVSFSVMADEGLNAAITTDHHFEQAGFVRLLT